MRQARLTVCITGAYGASTHRSRHALLNIGSWALVVGCQTTTRAILCHRLNDLAAIPEHASILAGGLQGLLARRQPCVSNYDDGHANRAHLLSDPARVWSRSVDGAAACGGQSPSVGTISVFAGVAHP
jgi:hypothetical protein